MIKEAAYYVKEPDGVRCKLCPHNCFIRDGARGFCRVRRNTEQQLIADSWGKISAVHLDPMEKKPLYHFYPGRPVLSIGSYGCNMVCKCCQNWQISQSPGRRLNRMILPEDVVESALSQSGNIGIAYTYNEPSVGFEYVLETAKLAQRKDLKNVMVSNGYISKEPLLELLTVIDAFNIDLKGFNTDFYRSFTGAFLDPVLETLSAIRKSGRHLEITCLIVPTMNDNPIDFRKMTNWIADHLGPETILHLSAYHPDYKLEIESTSAAVMKQLRNAAKERLFHVYAGNIRLENFQNTRCSNCGNEIVFRSGFLVDTKGLRNDGSCIYCGKKEIIR